MTRNRLGWLALAVVLVIAGVVSFFASSSPDGLEHVAETIGFDHAATDGAWRHSLFPDYEGASGVPTWLARVLGTLVVLGLMAGIARAAGRRRAGSR